MRQDNKTVHPKQYLPDMEIKILEEILEKGNQTEFDFTQVISIATKEVAKHEIKKLVEHYFSKENNEQAFKDRYSRFLTSERQKEEYSLSLHLAKLTLLFWQNNTKIKESKKADYNILFYIFFVFFLNNIEQYQNNADFKKELQRLLKDYYCVLDKKDFFQQLDETSNNIFNEKNENTTNIVFALLEIVKKNNKDIQIQGWENIFQKNITLEKIFYL